MYSGARDTVGEPLYVRTAAEIRRRLPGLGLKPGDPIEPERVLVHELGVSRITLRRAIDLLVDEHLLVRRQGVGTFVASPKITYPLVGLHSTRDIARAHGLSLDVSILVYETGTATSEERDRLELRRGSSVLRFERCDAVAGNPISISACVLPATLADGITPEALVRHSTYELIESSHPVKVTSARQILRAAGASPRLARLLSVHRGAPVLILDRVTFDASGTPIEWAVVSYPHDRAECVVELARQPGGRRESATGVVVQYPGREGENREEPVLRRRSSRGVR
jgi:GntR family transcriptional regulator